MIWQDSRTSPSAPFLSQHVAFGLSHRLRLAIETIVHPAGRALGVAAAAMADVHARTLDGQHETLSGFNLVYYAVYGEFRHGDTLLSRVVNVDNVLNVVKTTSGSRRDQDVADVQPERSACSRRAGGSRPDHLGSRRHQPEIS